MAHWSRSPQPSPMPCAPLTIPIQMKRSADPLPNSARRHHDQAFRSESWGGHRSPTRTPVRIPPAAKARPTQHVVLVEACTRCLSTTPAPAPWSDLLPNKETSRRSSLRRQLGVDLDQIDPDATELDVIVQPAQETHLAATNRTRSPCRTVGCSRFHGVHVEIAPSVQLGSCPVAQRHGSASNSRSPVPSPIRPPGRSAVRSRAAACRSPRASATGRPDPSADAS